MHVGHCGMTPPGFVDGWQVVASIRVTIEECQCALQFYSEGCGAKIGDVSALPSRLGRAWVL